MNRRNLVLALGAATLPLSVPAWAQAQPSAPLVRRSVDVVKVMSFACSFCLAAEAQDTAIEAASAATGGKFVRAPIPETAVAPGNREKTYYAARDLSPLFGERVKASLYRGTQDAQVQLAAFAQLYYWLLQDMPEEEANIARAIENAQKGEAAAALERAVRLTISAGVELLPTYVLVSNGQIVASMDTSTTGAKTMSALREAVITRINSN